MYATGSTPREAIPVGILFILFLCVTDAHCPLTSNSDVVSIILYTVSVTAKID